MHTTTMEKPVARQIVPATIREKVLHALHKKCREGGLQFYMSTHFLDRINLRAGDQDATFLNLMKSAQFLLARREEFHGQRVGIQIGAHFFFMRLDEMNKLACLTYYYNPTRTVFPEGADRKFRLAVVNQEESDEMETE